MTSVPSGPPRLAHAAARIGWRVLLAAIAIGRFHQLQHVMFGLVPMTLLYRAAAVRWSPGVITDAA